jgi:hypothetical protein
MKLHTRHTLPWLVLIYCSFMLTIILTACNTSGTGTTTIPTPTPTPAPALTTYPGQGYTIGYPKGWTYKKDNHQVAGHGVPATTFTNGINTLTVGVLPNPNGAISAQTVVATAVQLAGINSSGKNYQQVSIAPQTTVSGQTWNQAAATGDVTQQGNTVNAKAVGLACNYPANSPNTTLYIIVYGGPTATFDNTDSTAFQPILQSFKFS